MAKHGSHTPDKIKKQNEERARIEAEKALTPRESEKIADPVVMEKTLDERLKDIDRRARERAEEEKRQLAKQYYGEAQAKFRRLMSKTTDGELSEAYLEMLKLASLVHDDSSDPALPSEPAGERKGRRTPESLQADVERIIDYIRKNPGTRASHIRELGVDYGQSLVAFLRKYSPHTKLKVEGEKAASRYSI